MGVSWESLYCVLFSGSNETSWRGSDLVLEFFVRTKYFSSWQIEKAARAEGEKRLVHSTPRTRGRISFVLASSQISSTVNYGKPVCVTSLFALKVVVRSRTFLNLYIYISVDKCIMDIRVWMLRISMGVTFQNFWPISNFPLFSSDLLYRKLLSTINVL